MDLVTLAVAKKYTRDKIAEAAVGGVDITEYVNEKVDELINGASGTFDTLGEIETAVKNKVDKTTTINNKALSGNITLSASDVKALPDTTPIPSIVGLASETYVNNAVAGKMDKVTLATVATSGSYNDLSNKPTIPSIAGLATETYVDNAVANIVLTSEGGKKFKLTVDDSGVLTATEITE